jgi:hypothetical protein
VLSLVDLHWLPRPYFPLGKPLLLLLLLLLLGWHIFYKLQDWLGHSIWPL